MPTDLPQSDLYCIVRVALFLIKHFLLCVLLFNVTFEYCSTYALDAPLLLKVVLAKVGFRVNTAAGGNMGE